MDSREMVELDVETGLEAMARGELTSEAWTAALLERSAALNSRLNALTWQAGETALAEARAADAARAEGDERALLGVPVAIKDLLNVKGQPCTAGSAILKGYTAAYDATVIARLREAGAVFVSRTNTDEFAMGGSTETSTYGPTRNPWNPDCVPGGSSGGSAAAVAARLAPAALASDTGGSIRQPAAFCGVTGFKPTYGRVSRYGCTAFASSLDQVGPMARTVEDAARLYHVIAGADPADSTTSPQPVDGDVAALRDAHDLKGLRLGLPKAYFAEGLDPEVEQLTRAAIGQCRALGAELVEVDLPYSKYGIACYYILAPAEASANLARYEGVRYGNRAEADTLLEMYENTREQGFGAEVKRRVILGTYVLSSGFYDAYYSRAQRVRTLIRTDFEQALSQCDALLGPVTPTPAFRVGERSADPLAMYLGDIFTVNVNLAGLCGLSVPCGFTSSGLPTGLHIIGPAFGEMQVLKIGAAYQHATDWHLRRPADPPPDADVDAKTK
ncbi:MAG: Asp-tRNA(Asn)/Glu-tRNA(Gln) amidotransferase subunit GatA [Verrucomicrobiota bacterium]|jgi:aspartyl-tRNA(Asn)/glutamyl-tRNA(Gln) amidotransferase subunit A|nr:Asp-tRNA(Asn)/Glu-tRNA(Gln) amidotransferase subunit GatA [Verrucomicrobiota bacterium]